MQIMPATGKKLAKQAAIQHYIVKKASSRRYRYVTFGVKSLASLSTAISGKQKLALAACGTGNTRVDRWLKEFGNVDMVEFVEQIPFSETRGYVKQVLSNKSHYNLLTSLKTLEF